MTYALLDFSSIVIRVYTDGVYQNLKEKYSEVGSAITLSDQHNHSNINLGMAPELPVAHRRQKKHNFSHLIRHCGLSGISAK